MRIRPGAAPDAVRCTTLSTTYTTSHVWQLDARTEGDEMRAAFRLVRLPRELTLDADLRPPTAPRRGQLWLVAEELDTQAPSPSSGALPPEAWRALPPDMRGALPPDMRGALPPDMRGALPPEARGAPAAWSHTLRPSRGASAVQLSLPADRDPDPHPDAARARSGATRARPNDRAPHLDPLRAQPDDRDLRPDDRSPRPDDRDPLAAASGPPAAASGAHAADPHPPIVAYVTAHFRPGDAYAYLQSLAVHPAARRRGIAARLLAETLRWAAAEGAPRLLADVAARNVPALRLLQQAGLAFCGYNDRCYRQGEVAVFLSVEVRSLGGGAIGS